MKDKIKKIAGFLITFSLTIGCIQGLGHLTRPVDCDPCIKAIETFYELPKNSVDVIGYGSSHMWNGLNATEMYEKYGVKAYNYGNNWQALDTTYAFLRDSFQTQSPKVVLIECYKVGDVFANTGINPETYYIRALSDWEAKFHFLRGRFGNNLEAWFSYFMPLCQFHDNLWSVSTESLMINSSTYDFFDTMGTCYLDGKEYDALIPTAEILSQRPINETSLEVLDDMVALCRENGAEIIFYTHPYEGDYPYNDAMKAYAKENDCVYLNMFELIDEVGLTSTDFADREHLDRDGATKVADYLGKYIVENYELINLHGN